MSFDIDIAIIVVFLTATMAVGLLAGRKVTNIRDYALGNRSFTTSALVATMVSTTISGSAFYIILSKTYSGGWFLSVAVSGIAFGKLFTAFYLLPKMGEFLGKTSIAEAMGDMYGNRIRLIVAICGIISPIGSIAVQFKAFGNICQYFFAFSGDYAIYFAAGLTILYSSFGGLKAVTYTDVLQFFIFGVSVPIVGLIIWNSAYNQGIDLESALKVSKFNLAHTLSIDNPEFWSMVLLMLYFVVPCMTPTEFQRIAAGKNIAQVKKALVISAIVILSIMLAIAWIPFILYQLDSTLDSKNLLSHIINTYSFTGLKGLLIVGVIAMAMSTADSKINSSSVLFANDICSMLGIKSPPLLMSKIASFAIGGLGIYLAVTGDDLLDIIMFTASFYTAIVGTPWLMAILGFRTTALSVYIGMAAGVVSLLAWKIFNIDIKSMVLCMSSNFIFLMGSHYLLGQKGGWIKKAKLEPKP
ncbi:sodium:solute symporter family protein [Rickettsiaceae bacterium]|nr:sodium:solute symporter family protein [Rickettsiaceae bacterium]